MVSICKCQTTLSGIFSRESALLSDTFTFKLDNTFQYFHSSCQAKYSGYGSYFITEDRLTLIFKNTGSPKRNKSGDKIVNLRNENFFTNGEQKQYYIKFIKDNVIALNIKPTKEIDQTSLFFKIE